MPAFDNLLLIMVVAVAAPLLLGAFPRLLLPAVVLEILAGIALGPFVLRWVEVDQVVEVVALLGLAFVLFLAGLEIEFEILRGRTLRLASLGFALSFLVAIVVALGLGGADLVDAPLLVAIILCSTSLGVLLPVLKDSGQLSTPFGQLVIAAGSIADFGAIILLSLFFSGESGTGATVLLLGGLFALAGAVLLGGRGAQRSRRLRDNLLRLQDTTAQIRVRAALSSLVGFAALAEWLGLEVILGAFVAGAIIALVDRDEERTHPEFRPRLQAVGFGFFVPVFFVTTGVRLDVGALTASLDQLVLVPVFLAALLASRGIPAIVYRSALGPRQTAIAGLMQATSLPFVVAGTAIGTELGVLDAAAAAALVGAGLLSVLLFPIAGLVLLRKSSLSIVPSS